MEKRQSALLVDVGVRHMTLQGDYICMDIDSVVDYYSLPVYDLCGVSVVALHHSICV